MKEALGLIVVKPHAVETGLDITIQEVLNGKNNWLSERLNLPEDFMPYFLTRTRIYKTMYRDLGDKSDKSLRVMNIFYSKSREDRYYKTLLDTNLGKVAFFFLAHAGAQKDFDLMVNKLKGYPSLYVDGVLRPGYGLRGAILPPSKNVNGQLLDALPDKEYETAISSILMNGVHTPDSVDETCITLVDLLTPLEAAQLQASDSSLFSDILSRARLPENQEMKKWTRTVIKK